MSWAAKSKFVRRPPEATPKLISTAGDKTTTRKKKSGGFISTAERESFVISIAEHPGNLSFRNM